MKAINFLEWFKSLHCPPIGFNYTRDYWKKAIDFYSQPFDPKLITELFEGWEIEKPSEVDYISKRGNIRQRIIIWAQNYEYSINQEVISANSILTRYQVKRATTLDQFILDCSRAGIELTFNQQIADKYFK